MSSDDKDLIEIGLQSPAPGWYDYEKPYGWEEEGDLSQKEIEFRQDMHRMNPKDWDYSEDPILKSMRLEAEEADYKKHYKSPEARAKIMKKHVMAQKKLNFDRRPSQQSVSSYETVDFMNQPDTDIWHEHGEIAWLNAYKELAKQNKKMRIRLHGPSKKSTPSPVNIAKAYAKQSPAVQKAVAAVLAASSPPPSPKKFGDINLDSSDDEVPLPTNFAKKMSKAGKKSFFASPSKAKSPSPMKPMPPAVKKAFFAAPNLDSDSDDDLDIPGLKKISNSPPKKFSVTKKAFFASPSKQ